MEFSRNLSCLFATLLILLCLSATAQQDTVALKTLTVTAYKDKTVEATSLNISILKIDSLSRFGNYNLTDLLARTPGITMLSTGPAIAKPVIRGLYGNRVLVLVSGLKFDNQQWQEEHGLGISEAGLGRVELIKGPMSVLYGTEAMGGVINLIEEDKAPKGKTITDFGLKGNSNTAGGSFQFGIKKNTGNRWSRLRIGAENNADYSDGNGTRVLNSRFDGYFAKATIGFQKKNWTSNNHYMGSFNRYGFIFNDIYTFITADNRYSRALNVNPAHLVLLNLLTSENTFQLKSSKLNVNAGVQSNERMENEGGGAISLNMHLLTTQYLAKWEKQLNTKHRMILSNLGSFEINTNYGSRKIVPDALLQESNLSAYFESTYSKNFIVETGLGIGEKRIKTLLTPTVNTAEKDIAPFFKKAIYYNGFAGLSYFPSQRFNVKFNLSTGVRIPNLAELSSNGLHEGIFTYEIGNPNLLNEQNISANAYLNVNFKKIKFGVSPFVNRFLNYVYLAPTAESWYGFPVYRYLQQNALQFGTEGYAEYEFSKKIKFNLSYSGMISRTDDGNYTPYTPTQKVTPSLFIQVFNGQHQSLSFFINSQYNQAQKKTYTFEKGAPSYNLVNSGFTYQKTAHYHWNFSMAVNNIGNVAYYDNLSRFKNYGLLNMGRNITFTLRIMFGENQ